MAKRNVKITIPKGKPEEFSKLLNTIVKKDNELGADSVLKADSDIDMPLFATDLQSADNIRDQSEAAKAQSETLMQQANNLYGTGKGQDVNTHGTLYFRLDIIKKILLKKYKGNEEMLSNYGFDVVVGQSKSPVKKTQQQPPKQEE